MERSNLRLLDLSKKHVLNLALLPLHHRNPFDRILIAQAKHEGMHILTSDKRYLRRAADGRVASFTMPG